MDPIETLRDFAGYGLRADLNPTRKVHFDNEAWSAADRWWLNYLGGCDARVRSRAQAALDVPLWERDDIQFPRLLSEILATIEISNEDWTALRDSMDLEDDELQELFDRAQASWERAKERHT
jgi:hypothetical protein